MFDESIGMFVYEYTFLDDLSFIEPINEDHKINQYSIKDIFKKHGWEGDGEIGIIWLPPFLIDDGRTNGIYLWHVKQSNNGISFIISPCALPFGYLGARNAAGETFSSLSELTQEDITKLKMWQEEIIGQEHYLKTIPNHPEKEKLVQRALTSLHDDIIAEFKVWIDSYYLGILQEKFIHKNSKVKINLPKIKINTVKIADDWEGLPEHQKNWLTQANFISFAWNSFREYPMTEKLKLFLNAVDYKPNEDILKCIKTHIELRNSIHHDGGVITKKTLDRLGVCNINLSSDETFSKGDQIKLTVNSVIYFIDTLNTFINNYRDYMHKFFFYK